MAGYIIDSDGDSSFVIQAKRIAIREEDGTLRYVVGPRDFQKVRYEDLEDKPELVQVGLTASKAKPGNWKPKVSDVEGFEDAVKDYVASVVKDIPVASYADSHEALVDKYNQLLNALR